MIGLNYPKEFWLKVTNSVLGTLLLLLVALVMAGFVLDMIRRSRKRIKNSATTGSGPVQAGSTLPDGGEKLEGEDSCGAGKE